MIASGTRLGPYEVTALIGEGGMGKVWRGHHTALKRDEVLPRCVCVRPTMSIAPGARRLRARVLAGDGEAVQVQRVVATTKALNGRCP